MLEDLKIVTTGLALTMVLAVLPAAAGEGRIQFWEPIQINPGEEGSYILTRDITAVAGAAAIDVQPGVGAVEIDLNGFTVHGSNHAVIVGDQVDSLTVRNGTVTAENGIHTTDCRSVVIEDVTVLCSVGSAILLEDVAQFVVRRNIVVESGPGAWGILVANYTAPPRAQGSIEDNVVRGEPSIDGGIAVGWGSGVGIRGNRVEGAFTTAAMGTLYSDGVIFADNTVRQTGSGFGFLLQETTGSKLHNNVVARSGAHGISLQDNSNDNLVLDNVVTQSGVTGLHVAADWNHIERNVLNANGLWGMHLSGSGNTYRGNTAQENAGVSCDGSPATDFCDEGTGNVSPFHQPPSLVGDNLMPGLM